jgi:hypothetical protein
MKNSKNAVILNLLCPPQEGSRIQAFIKALNKPFNRNWILNQVQDDKVNLVFQCFKNK